MGLVLTQHFSEGVATQPHTHVLAQQGIPLWGYMGGGGGGIITSLAGGKLMSCTATTI